MPAFGPNLYESPARTPWGASIKATALIRLADADPDLDLPLCEEPPAPLAARVVLLAGLLEPVDEEQAKDVQADAILKKPFEASAVMETIRPLIEAAQFARGLFGDPGPDSAAPLTVEPSPEFKLKAVTEILGQKLVKRHVPLKGLSFGALEPAAGSSVRQDVSIQQAIQSLRGHDFGIDMQFTNYRTF